MAVAEQQQNLVNQAVKELQITKNAFKAQQGKPIHRIKIAKEGLQEGTAELIKTAKALGSLKPD